MCCHVCNNLFQTTSVADPKCLVGLFRGSYLVQQGHDAGQTSSGCRRLLGQSASNWSAQAHMTSPHCTSSSSQVFKRPVRDLKQVISYNPISSSLPVAFSFGQKPRLCYAKQTVQPWPIDDASALDACRHSKPPAMARNIVFLRSCRSGLLSNSFETLLSYWLNQRITGVNGHADIQALPRYIAADTDPKWNCRSSSFTSSGGMFPTLK